jgi:hypothetical protein
MSIQRLACRPSRFFALIAFFALATPNPSIANEVTNRQSSQSDSDEYLLIRSKGKYGLIDRSGKRILSPRYGLPIAFDSSLRGKANDYFDYQSEQTLLPVQIDHKWGYIERHETVVIRPQFKRAGPFRDGWAQVEVDDKWGIIDQQGHFVIEPRYSFIGPFINGLARVAIGGRRIEGGFPKSKWGFIDKSGETIVPIEYDYAQSFSNGRGLVNIGGSWSGESGLSFHGGLWGVVDESGKFVLEPKIQIASDLSLLESAPEPTADPIPIKYDGKFGYRDASWTFVIEPKFDDAKQFNDGLAVVKLADRFGYVDKTGQWAIRPRFKSAGNFSDGLAPVGTENGLCYVNKTGATVFDVKADEALSFQGELAPVRVGKLWGFIDARGEYVHQPQFSRVYHNADGIWYIDNSDGLRGLMSRKGKIIVPTKYGFIGGFQENGLAMIDTESLGLPQDFWLIDREGNFLPGPMQPMERDRDRKQIAFSPKRVEGKWGIVDKSDQFIIHPRFSSVHVLGDGILGVQEKNKWGLLDLETGKIIIEPTYYSIGPFSEGLAPTRPNLPAGPAGNGEWVGYINLEGRLVIPNKFADGTPFKNGIANVSVLYHGDTDWYYIDKRGKYLWHPDE